MSYSTTVQLSSESSLLTLEGIISRTKHEPEAEMKARFAANAADLATLVSVTTGQKRHVFIGLRGVPLPPDFLEAVLPLAREHFAADLLAYVSFDGPGWAVVELDHSRTDVDTAAALAVLQYSSSWDGITPKDISLPQGRYRVTTAYDSEKGIHSATVEEHSAPPVSPSTNAELAVQIRSWAIRFGDEKNTNGRVGIASKLGGLLRNLGSRNTRHTKNELAAIRTTIAWEHQVLPLMSDMGGFYALRHSGEVVSYRWDQGVHADSISPTIETDPRIRDIALVAGSADYPFLAPLLPARTPQSRTCSACNGMGTVLNDSKPIEGVICQCGGLGWIPERWG